MISDLQKPISSGFGQKTEPSEILRGINLDGKTIIVTGGYSGIGLETTRALRRCWSTSNNSCKKRRCCINQT